MKYLLIFLFTVLISSNIFSITNPALNDEEDKFYRQYLAKTQLKNIAFSALSDFQKNLFLRNFNNCCSQEQEEVIKLFVSKFFNAAKEYGIDLQYDQDFLFQILWKIKQTDAEKLKQDYDNCIAKKLTPNLLF